LVKYEKWKCSDVKWKCHVIEDSEIAKYHGTVGGKIVILLPPAVVKMNEIHSKYENTLAINQPKSRIPIRCNFH
jgi:hypothetical protein